MIIRKLYEEINKNIEKYLALKSTDLSRCICTDLFLIDNKTLYAGIKEYKYLTKKDLENNKYNKCNIYNIKYSEIIIYIKKEMQQ